MLVMQFDLLATMEVDLLTTIEVNLYGEESRCDASDAV